MRQYQFGRIKCRTAARRRDRVEAIRLIFTLDRKRKLQKTFGISCAVQPHKIEWKLISSFFPQTYQPLIAIFFHPAIQERLYAILFNNVPTESFCRVCRKRLRFFVRKRIIIIPSNKVSPNPSVNVSPKSSRSE